jgi:hypothetical protein
MIGTGGMRCRGALRGIEADFGPEHADTFRRDLHPDLRADYVLANSPFNDSGWSTSPASSYSTQIPVCLWFLSKSKAARVPKSSDNSAPVLSGTPTPNVVESRTRAAVRDTLLPNLLTGTLKLEHVSTCNAHS